MTEFWEVVLSHSLVGFPWDNALTLWLSQVDEGGGGWSRDLLRFLLALNLILIQCSQVKEGIRMLKTIPGRPD